MTRKTIGGNRIPVEIDELADGVEFPVSINDVAPGFEIPVTVNSTDVLRVTNADDASVDAFARKRFSTPLTHFDSKQIHSNGLVGENQPLIWNNVEFSGSGTTTSYAHDEAATHLGVSSLTAGRRIRQTRMWFNYSPGKSALVILTFNFNGLQAGVKKLVGQFNATDGIFLRANGTTVEAVVRSRYTGTPVDNPIPQSAWNLDKMDGTGVSGITLDWESAQILFFDYEWLGVGRVRMGFFVGGRAYYVHQFLHANRLPGVYMSSPNLPIRYEIENDGTGIAADLTTICSTVISEGGHEPRGSLRTIPPSTWATNIINANTVGTTYPVMGIRLTQLEMTVDLESYTVSSVSNDDVIISVHFNPTLSFTPTWNNLTESAVQYALGTTTNPSGSVTESGYVFSNENVTAGGSVRSNLNNAVRLGSTIAGVADQIWLCATPLSSNLDVLGTLNWKEML